MDFGQLLHTAQRNEKTKEQRVNYYSTKFEPPKKEKKVPTQLSENIKKFLAKKEAEEKCKKDEARKKRDELLALRSQDKKATKRVNVMLKRTKSANQSVIEDAVDNDNTAVTLAGPMQPDEDDYGYVSQEASQFYNQMMEKYNKMPDEPKFDMTKKKVSTNLGSTKDRVKAALEREKEEALLPHKRKRKHKEKEEDEDGVSYGTPDRSVEERHPDTGKLDAEKMPPPKPKPKPKMAPPPMNFADLLKIAEKKQFEPIVIEKKEKEDERLLTKRQRREMERERESQLRREERRKEILRSGIPRGAVKTPEKEKPAEKEKPPEKEPIKNQKNGENSKIKSNSSRMDSEKSASKSSSGEKEKPAKKPTSKAANKKKEEIIPEEDYIPGKYLPSDMRYRPELENKKPENKKPEPKKPEPKRPSSSDVLDKRPRVEMPQKPSVRFSDTSTKKTPPSHTPSNSHYKKVPSNDTKPVREPPQQSQPISSSSKRSSMESQPKRFPPEDVRRKPPAKLPPKQFPPPDIRRRDDRMGSSKKMASIKKGRILDDDDSEYDSEMDDFIDDGDEEQDYSKYISEIFGYDKSRYREIDDDVDNMETSFAQQMKEEVISTKLGIMEDLEEEKKEEEARRRKLLMKKKMRR